ASPGSSGDPRAHQPADRPARSAASNGRRGSRARTRSAGLVDLHLPLHIDVSQSVEYAPGRAFDCRLPGLTTPKKGTTVRVLITGGFGFIGTHLVKRLLRDPKKTVHIVDNLSTSAVEPHEFMRLIDHRSRVTFDAIAVADFCRQSSVGSYDEIYHLASV